MLRIAFLMGDTWDKMGLGLLLRLKYIGCRGRYETRLSFYTPLCYFLNFQFPLEPPLCYVFSYSSKGEVIVLHLLNRKLYCFELTRDYVTTLTNYKGWVTTKIG